MPSLGKFMVARLAAVSLLWAGLLVAPPGVVAQLRPLNPMGWSTFDRPGGVFLIGSAALTGQRISLAGAEGHLFEFGVFEATWSYERIAIRIGGTLFRTFDERSVYAEPVTDTRPPDGSSRSDAGDIEVSTLIWLTEPDATVAVGFRFGSRLPTTDNREGLGRDQADFFTTIGVRRRTGQWDLSVEGGAGINGTVDPEHEQIDPILFAGAVSYDAGRVDPFLEFTGQHDPRSDRDRRGNENLGEARLGVLIGTKRWLKVSLARGWTSTSPDLGITAQFGTRF